MLPILACSPRTVTLVVVLAAFVPVPGQATAQTGESFELFNECLPIGLLVENLPDDAADIELTQERIETLAESRLRAARLYAAALLNSYLYVRVGVLVSENGRGGAYSIEWGSPPRRSSWTRLGVCAAETVRQL